MHKATIGLSFGNSCIEHVMTIPLTVDRIDMEVGMVRFLGRDIHFPRGSGPWRDSSCWFTPGVLCSGGEDSHRSILNIHYGSIHYQQFPVFSHLVQSSSQNSSSSLPGVDLFTTISMFIGAIVFTIFAGAVMYCIRYEKSINRASIDSRSLQLQQ